MISFEQACSDTENVAEEARKSAARVVSQARALGKAAQTGNITAIKRTQDKLRESLQELEEEGCCHRTLALHGGRGTRSLSGPIHG